ncbi:NAD(P)/FAD-dependent oxidoreductase [Gammaproteobacteria bacterium]|nr:NAD(P)/FAD-dependent oxidoreductase [Gammaproteobacteria bacterium]
MHKDIIIVGAGISGIAAGYNLQKSCPDKSFAILEGREALGGTWDLFKYPGVRSDSDMHTLGFRFKPWINKKAIADGPSILKYLNETVDDYNLREKITYNQKVIASNWVSDSSIWELTVDDNGQEISMSCNFLFLCGGYYSYDKPYMPDFPGMDEFNGRVIHPQFWDESLDYSNKKVVVIGSGATAVTLVPAIAESAKQTTMLQRSPSYVISAPAEDSWNNALNKIFPVKFTYFVIRWKNILRTIIGFYLSRKYPERIKERLINLVREELGQDFDVEKHFTPSYKPWDQRMCLVPDGDLFSAIKDNRANVVTDTIDTFTPTGILLNSGNEIEADIVISATGIELNALNDINVSVDGVKVEANRKLSYKGMMLSGVPNLAISFGYVNSSWTLRADLTCEYVCRLINTMDKEGCAACSPEEDLNALVEDDYIDFTSGYVQRALDRLPKQGKKSPWRNYQNYLLDIFYVRLFSIKDSTLRFYNPKN